MHIMMGTVNYSAPIEGLELEEELEVPVKEPQIEKIVMKTQNGEIERIVITVTLKGIFESDDFRSITDQVVEKTLNRIAFHHSGIYIGSPMCESYCLPKKDSEGIFITFANHVVSYDRLEGPYRPREGGRRRIIEYLEKTTPLPGEPFYALFNFSARQKDPVTRFMFLYNILLSLHGDSQKNVDIFIQAEEPGVKIVSRTCTGKRGTMKNETIYTSLRNRVGHMIPGNNLSDTYTEISQIVGSFEMLVKKAIEKA